MSISEDEMQQCGNLFLGFSSWNYEKTKPALEKQ